MAKKQPVAIKKRATVKSIKTAQRPTVAKKLSAAPIKSVHKPIKSSTITTRKPIKKSTATTKRSTVKTIVKKSTIKIVAKKTLSATKNKNSISAKAKTKTATKKKPTLIKAKVSIKSKKPVPAPKKAVAKKTKKENPAKKMIVIKKTVQKKSPVKTPSLPIKKAAKKKSTLIHPVKKIQRKSEPKLSNKKVMEPMKTESSKLTVAADAAYMTSTHLNHFHQALKKWKNDLMARVDTTIHHMQDEAANFADPNDRATQEEEFSLELRTRDRERKLMIKIDEAIERIEAGDYGFCTECGIGIGLERLEARPTATLCIDCKTLDEIREKQMAD